MTTPPPREEREDEMREWRVNDYRGIYGPMDHDSAVRLHAQLAASIAPQFRQPVIEYREIGPWRDAEYGDVVNVGEPR